MTTAAHAGFRESDPARLLRQIDAIDRWNAARRQLVLPACPPDERATAAGPDAEDVVAHVHRALQDQTLLSMSSSGCPMAERSRVTAVIAHRHAWFATSVARCLAQHDVAVLTVTDRGSEALGIVVAEQPDLLLVGRSLDVLAGPHLLAQAAVFAPSTLLAAQVGCREDAPAMLRAGAHTSFAHGVPPADVAEALTCLVARPSASLASAM